MSIAFPPPALKLFNALVALALSAAPVLAQNYPEKPITSWSPTPRGTLRCDRAPGRAEHVGHLGQQIIIEKWQELVAPRGGARRKICAGWLHAVDPSRRAGGRRVDVQAALRHDAAFPPIGLMNYGPFVFTARADYTRTQRPKCWRS